MYIEYMRKISKEIATAFYNHEKLRKDNTTTDGDSIMLHGNKIAEHNSIFANDGNTHINITLAGWNTNTTRERLNALHGVRVTTKQGQAYLNGEKWDGEWITI